MTAKEKAIEIFDKFDKLLPCEGTTIGQTAIDISIIHVDGIIEELSSFSRSLTVIFWREVKNELNKL